MKPSEQRRALECAVKAARAAGKIMRANLGSRKTVSSSTQHDIKLELDVRCQKLIENSLRSPFPAVGLLGEEGVNAVMIGVQEHFGGASVEGDTAAIKK